MNDDDRDDENSEPRGFAFEMAGGALSQMFNSARAQHQQEHMAAEDRMMQVDEFLSQLTPTQLICLRYILSLEPAAETNQFFDGQAHALLRFVHQVDPMTGKDQFKELVEGEQPES